MTNKYNNVYIKDSYTIGLMYEGNGPLKEYFDKVYMDDLYYNEKSFEKAEIKMLRDSINGIINDNNRIYRWFNWIKEQRKIMGL